MHGFFHHDMENEAKFVPNCILSSYFGKKKGGWEEKATFGRQGHGLGCLFEHEILNLLHKKEERERYHHVAC